MWRNGKGHYGLVSISFHWIVALAFVGLAGLGAWMVDLTYYDPWYHRALSLHKEIGIAVLALSLARAGWRLVDRKPGFAPEVRPFERAAAAAAHWILYAVVILLPVTGYLISTSEGAGIEMFGAFELPALVDVPDPVRDLSIEAHFYLAYGGIALAAVHAGAALKHHFVDGGSTLARMLAPRPPARRPVNRGAD